MLTPADIQFILEHETADTTRLLLSKQARAATDVQISLCAKCIDARQRIKEKIPLWYACHELVYPFPLSVEQCSSQATAQYKQTLVGKLADWLQSLTTTKLKIITSDLTGGMGVDSYFLSRRAKKHFYIERNAHLCTAAVYNFKQLGADNISVLPAECHPDNRELFSFLAEQKLSLIYVDPARRSKAHTKVISLQDYEPNLLELKEELLRLAPFILVKISPMADIRQTLQWLPETVQVHVVSVNNECKELLFLLASPYLEEGKTFRQITVNAPSITAVDLFSEPVSATPAPCIRSFFHFTLSEEEQASAPFASELGLYLYEPGKALLKSGAYKLIAQRTGLKKLAPSTHLYTANDIYPQRSAADHSPQSFPGKIYPILRSVNFNKKNLKEVAKEYPCADLSARNFPLDTNGLKKLSGIKDGGDHHLFAVTLVSGEKKIIICKKALKN